MSAEIIQFVPRPNPKREEAEQRVAEAFHSAVYHASPSDIPVLSSLAGVWPDFSSPAVYHAPDKDSA